MTRFLSRHFKASPVNPAGLWAAGLCLAAGGLPLGRAWLSVGVALCAAAGGWAYLRGARFERPARRSALPWASYWALTALSTGWTDAPAADVWAEARVKLPLLLLPAAAALFPAPDVRLWRWVGGLFVGAVTAVSIATLIHYLMNADAIDAATRASTPFPIVSLSRSMNHIYFSVMMAWAVFLCLWATGGGALADRRARRGAIGLGVFLFVCMHVFTTRTGLLACYAGLGTGGLVFVLQRGGRRALLAAAAVIPLALAAPVAAYFALPSLRNRVENTREDWAQYRTPGADLSHWSVARRFAAWQTALHVWAENPVLGVGPAAVKPRILAQYEREPFVIRPEHRVADPHNQFLEALVGLGVVGLGVLFWGIIAPLTLGLTPARAAFLAIFVTAMLAESMLERQWGVTLFALFHSLLFAGRKADDAPE